MPELTSTPPPKPLLCLPAPEKPVSLVCRPHPFSSERIVKHLPFGHCISDQLKELDLDPDQVEARVFLDDVFIEKAYWHRVKPKAGHLVTIRVIPQGGQAGTKDILRITAMIGVLALAIAAPYLAAAVLPAGLGGLFATSAGVGVLGTALTAGVLFGGSLKACSLIPPSRRLIGETR